MELNSGERTRLACWRWRPVSANFYPNHRRGRKFVAARRRNPHAWARALPRLPTTRWLIAKLRRTRLAYKRKGSTQAAGAVPRLAVPAMAARDDPWERR